MTPIRTSSEAKALSAKIEELDSSATAQGERAAFVDLIKIVLKLNADLSDIEELQPGFVTKYTTDFGAALTAAAAASSREDALSRRLRDRSIRQGSAWLAGDAPVRMPSEAFVPAAAPGAAALLGDDDSDTKSQGAMPSAYPPVWHVAVAQPPGMVKLSSLLDKRVKEILDVIAQIRMHIKLQLPSASDGNNFNVEVMNILIQNCNTVEESCCALLTELTTLFAKRAALVTRLAAAPTVTDFHRALVHADAKEYTAMITRFRELMSVLVQLHGMLDKNWKRVKARRESNMHSLLY